MPDVGRDAAKLAKLLITVKLSVTGNLVDGLHVTDAACWIGGLTVVASDEDTAEGTWSSVCIEGTPVEIVGGAAAVISWYSSKEG